MLLTRLGKRGWRRKEAGGPNRAGHPQWRCDIFTECNIWTVTRTNKYRIIIEMLRGRGH
jgi:hypothetical protein